MRKKEKPTYGWKDFSWLKYFSFSADSEISPARMSFELEMKTSMAVSDQNEKK